MPVTCLQIIVCVYVSYVSDGTRQAGIFLDMRPTVDYPQHGQIGFISMTGDYLYYRPSEKPKPSIALWGPSLLRTLRETKTLHRAVGTIIITGPPRNQNPPSRCGDHHYYGPSVRPKPSIALWGPSLLQALRETKTLHRAVGTIIITGPPRNQNPPSRCGDHHYYRPSEKPKPSIALWGPSLLRTLRETKTLHRAVGTIIITDPPRDQNPPSRCGDHHYYRPSERPKPSIALWGPSLLQALRETKTLHRAVGTIIITGPPRDQNPPSRCGDHHYYRPSERPKPSIALWGPSLLQALRETKTLHRAVGLNL